MAKKKLTELTPERLEVAIKAGDEIVDDREIPEDFTREDDDRRGE